MPLRTVKWAWRANGARLRSLEAKDSLSPEEERERQRLAQWLADHDEPKPMRDR
jgi:hypothetical protein